MHHRTRQLGKRGRRLQPLNAAMRNLNRDLNRLTWDKIMLGIAITDRFCNRVDPKTVRFSDIETPEEIERKGWTVVT